MPTYIFGCPECGAKVEQKRAFDDKSEGPTCGDCIVEMKKVFQPTAVVFKGSGFYKTDSQR